VPASGHGDLQLDMRKSDWRPLVGSEVSNPGAFIIPSNDGRFESTDTNIEYTRSSYGYGKKIDIRARD